MAPASARRRAFLDWLLKQSGKPVLWAQKGPDVFDCSGLVTRGFAEVGVPGLDPNFTNTDKLWAWLPPTDKPERGDLVFYGGTKPNDVEHVMIYWGEGWVFGACGATSKITTIQEARIAGARVRSRKLGYRSDFRGFRVSPLDEPVRVA